MKKGVLLAAAASTLRTTDSISTASIGIPRIQYTSLERSSGMTRPTTASAPPWELLTDRGEGRASKASSPGTDFEYLNPVDASVPQERPRAGQPTAPEPFGCGEFSYLIRSL